MNIENIIEYANAEFNQKYVSEVPMGGIDSRVVKYINNTAGVLRAPTNFVYGEALTITGSMLGRKVTVIDGTYRNRCNSYSAIVGVASGAKSPTINYVMRQADALDRQINDEYERSYNAAKNRGSKGEELPANLNQLIASNETIENLYKVLDNVKNAKSGLLFHQDELLNFFGVNAKKYSDGNIISDFLTLFDGFSPLRVGRVRMEKRIYAPEPFIAILGGVQKKRIDELFAGQEHNGFFSRWLFWLPNPDSPLIEDGDATADQNWAELLERSTSSDLENLVLHFENVKQVRAYDDEYRRLRDILEEQEEDDLSETIMKQGYYIRRLAAIIHCMNALAQGYRPSDTIREETVEYAAQVVEWLFKNSCIIQRVIESKRRRRISVKEAIIALDAACGIANQSMFSASLSKGPSQPYISKVLNETKKK